MKRKKSKTTKKALKASAAKLRRKALKLWTEIVRRSGDNKCAVCNVVHGTLNHNGKPRFINAHHIEDKCNYSTRWDTKNGVALCASCHQFHNPSSAHRSPVWFLDWLEKNRPGTISYILVARNLHPHTALGWTLEDLIKLVDDLEKQRAALPQNTTEAPTEGADLADSAESESDPQSSADDCSSSPPQSQQS